MPGPLLVVSSKFSQQIMGGGQMLGRVNLPDPAVRSQENLEGFRRLQPKE